MQDFPPRIATFFTGSDDAPSPDPDTRSPAAFLRWVLGQQKALIALSSLCYGLWFLPQTLGPWIFGRAVDQGIVGGSTTALLGWAALLLLVVLIGSVFGIVSHTLVVRSWLVSLYGTLEMVTRKVAQMGHVLPRRSPTGEVLSVASSDSDEFGALTEIVARAAGQLVSYLTVAFIVLTMSWQLGLLTLVAAPVLLGAALPLLRPLHARQQVERSRTSDLTSMATDIVAGLRILRGIGGEQTFGANYARQSQSAKQAGVAAGIWQAVVEAVGVLLSGIFLVALVWLGTRQVESGDLTVGELITFLGYGLFMVGPIRTFFELAQKGVRSLVSARKAIAIFEQRPPWRPPVAPVALDGSGALHDEASGLTVRPGILTVVVSAVPEQSAAVADRLGRYLPADTEPVPLDDDEAKGRAARRARAARAEERARLAALDEERAGRDWGVTLGGVDLARADLREVRRQVLVSDTGSQLFAGTLQDAVDPHGRLSREQAEHALRVANAEDVYDALPEGWQGQLDERGRGLSGGQRQRVVLARAVAADPPVLVLVEPTSAVDAHTEARIAARVAETRRGRTTVVTTVSPLWLHHADHVVLLHDGTVVAEGDHADLLAADDDYRHVVARALDDDPETEEALR
ncbi:ABC-type multidrug transport system fused ATPase/permease subunit [Nocardioides cavernae]|uniref:ABC-type multidrug transport system fused ATPase/permease subunit n=1 Tax=Nocardioides cavernae TaxID=1921566 RepID=A0A7Y9H3L2_9ACTN|nr:ABC transporter ATP-binding protein [Nocardioides cavernae]NYE36976.1 ABC-type multidrug transport system fused ATPase/permease subunit [Nocardioides cavernae]